MIVRRLAGLSLPMLGAALLLLASMIASGCSFGSGSAPSSRAAVTQYFNKVSPPVTAKKTKGRGPRGGAVAKVKSIKGRIFSEGGTPE
jgi:hypothetical protein